MAHNITEFAFCLGVAALEGVMPNLLTLVNFSTAAFADYFHEEAFIKLMSSKDKLVVGELVLAPNIITLKPNLVHILSFELV